MKRALLSSLFALLFVSAHTQVQLTGKVSDEGAYPLPGVNVFVKTTQTGTVTNDLGEYSVTAHEGAVLQFSMVGFSTYSVKVKTAGTLDVTLWQGIELSAVVVTALGVDKSKDALPFAHDELNAEPLALARENNLGDALAGLVPGVNVSNVGSGPGGSTRIVIRGYHSVSRDNQPLFVVDGVPIDNRTLGSASLWGGQDWGDGLSSLNPDDIEKISVLKGNAAAALYGSRASNGVILITTKKGANRKGIGVEVNSNFTVDQPLTRHDFQQEFGQGWGHWKPGSQGDAFGSNWFNWGPRLSDSPGNPNYAIAVLPPNVPVEALKGENGDGSKPDGNLKTDALHEAIFMQGIFAKG